MILYNRRALFSKSQCMLVSFIFLFLMLTALPFAHAQSSAKEIKAPNIEFTTSDGKKTTLYKYTGKKPVVLHFWTTWCPSCRKEWPSLYSAYKRLNKKVNFLMVNLGENAETVDIFFKEMGYTVDYLLDPKRTAAARYNVRSIPTTFILDAKGDIQDLHKGIAQWDNPKSRVITLLNSLLKDKAK